MEGLNTYRRICLLALLVISSFCKAQEYIPINFENSIWIEKYFPGFGAADEKYQKYCSGDSIYNDTTYFKLYESSVLFNSGIPDTSFHNYLGLIRNSTNKTVKFIPKNNTESVVIYDFNHSIGDTIHGSVDHFIINEIDSVEICGKYQKRYIQDIGTTEPSETLIEGVGFSNGLLGYFNVFDQLGESTITLACFTNSNNSDCSECDLINKIQEYRAKINLFPNPFKDRLVISSSRPMAEIMIINCSGIEEFRAEINDDVYIDMSLQHIESGIYIIKIVFSDNKIKTYTAIKK